MLEDLIKTAEHARTIEHFLLHGRWEQCEKELREILEIYPDSLRCILDDLQDAGLIRITKVIAGSRFYRLNQDSSLVPPLQRLSQLHAYQSALKVAEAEGVWDIDDIVDRLGGNLEEDD